VDPKVVITIFVIVSLVIVTIITAFGAVLTQAIKQINAQSLNVTKQNTYSAIVNVHFKIVCISVIVFTMVGSKINSIT
jgi:hypothetical protein